MQRQIRIKRRRRTKPEPTIDEGRRRTESRSTDIEGLLVRIDRLIYS